MFKEVSNLDMYTHHQGINSHYIDQIEKLYSVSDTACKIIFIFDRHWFNVIFTNSKIVVCSYAQKKEENRLHTVSGFPYMRL